MTAVNLTETQAYVRAKHTMRTDQIKTLLWAKRRDAENTLRLLNKNLEEIVGITRALNERNESLSNGVDMQPSINGKIGQPERI